MDFSTVIENMSNNGIDAFVRLFIVECSVSQFYFLDWMIILLCQDHGLQTENFNLCDPPSSIANFLNFTNNGNKVPGQLMKVMFTFTESYRYF